MRLIPTRLLHYHILFIVDSAGAKFSLNPDDLATVWTPMLESIKLKRRNTMAKIRKSVSKPVTLFFRCILKCPLQFYLLDDPSDSSDSKNQPNNE